MYEPEAAPFQPAPQQHGPAAAALAVIETEHVAAWTLRSRALECAGYLPGDQLLIDMQATPRRGDIVCAQVYNNNLGVAETIMRLYEPPYLVAATYDQSLRRPLVADDDSVVIMGVCVASLRPRITDPRD